MSPLSSEYDDWDEENPNECFLLSEESLARDWNRPEEDAAWAHLQIDYDKVKDENGPSGTP